MWLVHGGKNCVEIDGQVFRKLLSFYPEERLLSRPILSAAIERGSITKSDLMEEAEKAFIPWQMFLLNRVKLSRQLRNIEKNRADKVRITSLASRPGRDGPIPLRLIDRYIRTQSFLVSRHAYERNKYCNMLRGRDTQAAVSAILSHFRIDRSALWLKTTKQAARDYLVDKIMDSQINVAIGVSESRIVPTTDNHRHLYKNISGFCLKDAQVPFIFVNASMSDDEEPLGRQIYTLIYLVSLVGLGWFTVTREWGPSQTRKRGTTGYIAKAHSIASELLLPASELALFKKTRITDAIVQGLSDKHKLTPTAVVHRLWRDQYITDDQRDLLMPEPFVRQRTPKSFRIDNAVNRLNGKLVVKAVHRAVTLQAISQNQAQYILFGRIRRDAWQDYRARANL